MVLESGEKEKVFLLPNGLVVTAELHWYEASGVGKREYKIKAIIEE